MKKERKLPKFKKEVNAFLVGEEGKISKESLFKAGAFFGIISLYSLLNTSGVAAGHTSHNSLAHSNGPLSISYDAGTATATHTHHANTAHTSHGSHGSHSSNGWPW